MKKLLLISILALCSMTMRAQITYDGVLDGYVEVSQPFINVPYYCTWVGDTVANLYNNDLSLYKTVVLPHEKGESPIYTEYCTLFAMNIYTTDGKMCFLQHSAQKVTIYNEDGKVIKYLATLRFYGCSFALIDGTYKLLIYEKLNTGGYKTHIYTLPGNGQPTDLEAPTAPTRTSNARKVVENGQMYIILDGVKYAVTGSTTM